MQEDRESDHRHETYILIKNLGQRLKLFRDVGIKTPGAHDPFVIGIQDDFCHVLAKTMPERNVITIDMEDLSSEIAFRALDRCRGLKKAVVVSTCLEIAVPRDGCVLELNRIIDYRGTILGIGPRPGFAPIEKQLDIIASIAGKKTVVLVEDGSFTGRTLSTVIAKLQKRGLHVGAIVLGFTFPGALRHVKECFKGEIVVVKDFENPIDWMPEHDFFPFFPNCGRTLGTAMNGHVFPFYNEEGATFSVPYIYPFAPVSDWASIPAEKANQFSLFCLYKTLEIFRYLEEMNGREIKIGDLMGIRPRVSIPVSIDQSYFPSLDSRVTHFLEETCHELS